MIKDTAPVAPAAPEQADADPISLDVEVTETPAEGTPATPAPPVAAEAPAPAQEPAAAPAAVGADPWGLDVHEGHKVAVARERPPLPDVPADRTLAFDEFAALMVPHVEAFVRESYQDYLESRPR